ncbi:MAG: tyrosine-type recombinase/integrase [Lachnospiraceae bacterium]|nr:tyrosine-type recombinase/integrase [Lachnospiraceae bacterium]
MRHTSATLLIANNVDVKTVSERLGHKQIGTTLNIYAHSLKERDEYASSVLKDVLYKKAK